MHKTIVPEVHNLVVILSGPDKLNTPDIKVSIKVLNNLNISSWAIGQGEGDVSMESSLLAHKAQTAVKRKEAREEARSRAHMRQRVASTTARLLMALSNRAGQGRRRVVTELVCALRLEHATVVGAATLASSDNSRGVKKRQRESASASAYPEVHLEPTQISPPQCTQYLP